MIYHQERFHIKDNNINAAGHPAILSCSYHMHETYLHQAEHALCVILTLLKNML